jgi:hypothetical protein
MLPKNMPYYHGHRIRNDNGSSDATASTADVCVPPIGNETGLHHLAIWIVSFGLNPGNPSFTVDPTVRARTLYNSEPTSAAGLLSRYDWAIYGFNSGHFLSTICEMNLPFNVVLVCNPFVNGALFSGVYVLPHNLVRHACSLGSCLGFRAHIAAYGLPYSLPLLYKQQANELLSGVASIYPHVALPHPLVSHCG